MILNAQTRRWVGLSAVAVSIAPFAWAQPSTPPVVAPVQFDSAMLHFERCQWPQAFQQLAALADAGHGQAARIALLMHAHGTRLFAGRFNIEARQRDRWLDTAAASPPGFDGAVGIRSQAQAPVAR